jgi:hypothetical protein
VKNPFCSFFNNFFYIYIYIDIEIHEKQHILLYVFTFIVPCCDIRYDVHINMMFDSSLPPVVCMRAHVLLKTRSVTHIYSTVKVSSGLTSLFFDVCIRWFVHISIIFSQTTSLLEPYLQIVVLRDIQHFI